jgi:acetolactate decarboxylase
LAPGVEVWPRALHSSTDHRSPPDRCTFQPSFTVQPEFEFDDVAGTLVGFWTPEYAKTLNVPGYHLHFLSTDHKNGGHLLQCRGSNLRLQIQRGGEYRLALPETEDFLKADLRRDPAADLARAEGERK